MGTAPSPPALQRLAEPGRLLPAVRGTRARRSLALLRVPTGGVTDSRHVPEDTIHAIGSSAPRAAVMATKEEKAMQHKV